MKRVLAILVIAFPCVSFAGYVQTMSFTGVNGAGLTTFTEDGITATGAIASFDTPETAHIDRAGTPTNKPISFTTGSLFTPLSVMLRPMGSAYCATCDVPGLGGTDPIPYIWFSGYVDDVLVSTAGFYLPESAVFSPFSLSFLGEIDTLVIQAKNFMDFGLPGSCNINRGCGHFSIDDVKLMASVPEPATFALFGIALLALGWRRLRFGNAAAA